MDSYPIWSCLYYIPHRSVNNMSLETLNQSPRSVVDLANPKHKVAVKLQTVYKSCRTRRKLADCVVPIEQRWWKLLNFAELKHSSISFFDIEHHETAISRWSRAKTRATKVLTFETIYCRYS